MELNAYDREKLMLAATLNTTIESTGLQDNKEAQELYNKVVQELNEAPAGTMVEPVFDLPDDKYDKLIEASEKAHGKLTMDKIQKLGGMTMKEITSQFGKTTY